MTLPATGAVIVTLPPSVVRAGRGNGGRGARLAGGEEAFYWRLVDLAEVTDDIDDQMGLGHVGLHEQVEVQVVRGRVADRQDRAVACSNREGSRS